MSAPTTISAVQTLMKSLHNPHLKQILSIIGNETQLDEVQRIITNVDAKLRAAESRMDITDSHVLKEPAKFEELIDEAYKANVELEKFISLAHQKQLLEADDSLTLSEKMRLYYYRFNRHGLPSRVSQLVKHIRSFLCAFDFDFYGFNFQPHDPSFHPELKQCIYRSLVSPYVHKDEIVGRENDLENVVGMLLDSNIQRDVSFLSIAGIGGVGKTTLAQLLLKDYRVLKAFKFRIWVSVGDHNKARQNVRSILDRILLSTTYGYEIANMDTQSLVQKLLSGKKFLLVLDDIWCENPDELHQLSNCLVGGQRGSWIIVTTRSRRTATAIQDGQLYELQCLSEENSWRLFQGEVANESDSEWELGGPNESDNEELNHMEKSNNEELNQMEKEILAVCARNPFAISLARDLFRGAYKEKWQPDHGLDSLRQNYFVPIILPSYYSLESPLKSCFIYCAMYPQDCTINKDMLISLWMAHDCMESMNKGVSPEDLGEEYFSTLVEKYFFKDIKRDKYGDIVSCKMHDFFYYLAQQLAKGEIQIMSAFGDRQYKGARHVSVLGGQRIRNDLFGNINILSYLHVGYNNVHFCNVTESYLKRLLEKCKSLKALDLSWVFFESLPDTIGDLSLLRYLNLSGNIKLEVLPRAMTRLHNLQTLNLQECHKLKEFPKDFNMLVNLRLLNIRSCSSLTCMPRGIGKLTNLHKLSDFMVSDEGSYTSWNEVFDALEDLKPLDNLRGHLNIEIRCPIAKYGTKEDARKEGLYPLKSNEHLKIIEFNFKHEEVDGKLDIEGVTRLMKELQPPSNLQYIKLWRYQGVRIGWDTFPSNLVQLVVVGCWELECLPCLGNLRHLKVLQLLKLKKLEYIGQDGPLANSSSYYPSLETLRLENLPKLTGWRKGEIDDHVCQIVHDGGNNSSNTGKAQWQLVPYFPHLKSLVVWNCPQLAWLPSCPTVEDLKLVDFNSTLRIMESVERGEKLGVTSTSASRNGIDIPECSSSHSYVQNGKYIKKVALSNVAWLNSMPMEAFQHLESLEIWCDKEVESLGEVEELFQSCSSSLRILIIHNCSNLKSVVRGGLKHLTALEKLEIRNCDNLTLREEQGERNMGDSVDIGMIKWSLKLQALHSLKLEGLPQLVNLPDWIQFLPSLEYLCISFCNQLKSMPDWIPKIRSLRQIIVHGCSASLEKRCQEHKYWPHIQFRNCVF